MTDTKRTIDQWNAQRYDSNYSFVSKYGNTLIELLAPTKGECILDLGCGTGDLAKKLADVDAHVIGVDQSENMVLEAQRKYPSIEFHVQDATNLPYENEFDAIFSNATLHWVKPPKKALQSIFNSLKSDGRFVAEFGGKGNVQIITDEIIRQRHKAGSDYQMEQFPWYYPSIAEYTTLMEKVGFRVTFAEHYDRPTPLDGEQGLRNWMKMFASSFFEDLTDHERDTILSNVESELKDRLYQDGTWVADYKRIRVVGVKEK